MGQEILHEHFTSADFEQFQTHLKSETLLLNKLFKAGEFSSRAPVGGFEIEGCLVDRHYRPAPINKEFLERFNNPLATSELARFNIELNNLPHALGDKVFTLFEKELQQTFKDADRVASELHARVLLTGILATLVPDDLSLKNMTDMKRYHALNKVILDARRGKPLVLDISGKDHLQLTHDNVMMESTTTSFQVHMQAPWQDAHHYYNASLIASAPIMAIAANSPFLFGRQLWQETRIPVFERSIVTADRQQRVSFGKGFARQSIVECFNENLSDFPPLLPMLFEQKADRFKHLSLHNGVIWRWNRPLVGFDEDGTPHVRIEHRILPAGPTISDMLANAVFFYGITQSLVKELKNGEIMPFEQARENFYRTAKYGLNTEIQWNGKTVRPQSLILDKLLTLAQQGLLDLGIDSGDIEHYLGIIAERTANEQTGAMWQIQHMKQNNCSIEQLSRDYLHQQHLNQPVHTWSH